MASDNEGEERGGVKWRQTMKGRREEGSNGVRQ